MRINQKCVKKIAVMLLVMTCLISLSGAALAVTAADEKEITTDSYLNELASEYCIDIETIKNVSQEINDLKAVFPDASISIEQTLEFEAEMKELAPNERLNVVREIINAGPIEIFETRFEDGSFIRLEVYADSVSTVIWFGSGSLTVKNGINYYTGSTAGVLNIWGLSNLYYSFKVDHYFYTVGSTKYGSVTNSYVSEVGWGYPLTLYAPYTWSSTGTSVSYYCDVMTAPFLGEDPYYNGTVSLTFNAKTFVVDYIELV